MIVQRAVVVVEQDIADAKGAREEESLPVEFVERLLQDREQRRLLPGARVPCLRLKR